MDDQVSKDQVKSFVDRTKASASALAGDAKSQVEELAGPASEMAENVYGQVRTQAREVAATVAKTVEQQPLTALLIGGLACGALGFLLARR